MPTRHIEMIRTRLTLLFLLALTVVCGAPAPVRYDLKVLFIGNSFTSANDLPAMLRKLALSGGVNLYVDKSAPDGWTLSMHADPKQGSATLAKIENGRWDFVVLQEQSQYPAYSNLRVQMYAAARTLDKEIRKSSAKTVFFMTWGYRNGDPTNARIAQTQNFESMQEQLRAGYAQISTELSAVLCPVGMAWLKAKEKDSTVDPWSNDGKHPSIEGTYLSACAFYATLVKKSPVGLKFMAGLSTEKAQFLQAVASEVCLKADSR